MMQCRSLLHAQQARVLKMLRSADAMTFFRAWLSNPLSVGAVAPSSKSLAYLITNDLNPLNGPVLELGPGTGVFTDALIRGGVMERDLTLVELESAFAKLLAARYPQATVLTQNAAYLEGPNPSSVSKYGVIVSGLPLLSLSPSTVVRILIRAFALSRNDAAFYQFTYGWRCPVPKAILERLDLHAIRIGTVFSNLPPASVYKIVRNTIAKG